MSLLQTCNLNTTFDGKGTKCRGMGGAVKGENVPSWGICIIIILGLIRPTSVIRNDSIDDIFIKLGLQN